MAETKQYLDYDGLVRVIELIQTAFPTKQITVEAYFFAFYQILYIKEINSIKNYGRTK